MVMLAMTILVHFWVLYVAIGPSTCTTRSNLRHYSTWRMLGRTNLAHARPASSLVRTVHGAFYVP